MDDKFYNRDFEQFVKNNADQYRMFPSEKVWKNIHHNLHTRRKWYGIGIGLLLLSIGAVTGVMVSNPSARHLATNTNSIKPINVNIVAAANQPIPFKVQNENNVIVQAPKEKFSTPETFQNNLFSSEANSTELTEDEIANQFTNSILPALITIISNTGNAINLNMQVPDVAMNIPLISKKPVFSTPVVSPVLIDEPVPTTKPDDIVLAKKNGCKTN